MNQKLKQRLVGAVVLTSLAIIFVPMLLDGNGGKAPFEPGGQFPAEPDYQFKTIEIPLDVPPEKQPQPQLMEQQNAMAPVEKPKAEPIPSETPKQSALVQPKQSRPKAKTLPSSQSETWVVQLGSFSSADNALGLRDRLRKQGFPAFVEKVRTDEGLVYRVRVGPEVKRDEAEQKRERIAEQLELKGLVMRHHDN